MKKIIISLIILANLLAFPTAFAENETPSVPTITVTLNGEKLKFDVDPYIENDRTLVPMRKIFEAVGANVAWDDEMKTVVASRMISNNPIFVAIQIGGESAFVNNVKTNLDTPAKIVDDRTFVPLRFVVEALGEKVEWDGNTYTVIITTNTEN